MEKSMKFCGSCGAELVRQIPNGENRMRDVCLSCNTVHYQNPKLIVGTLPHHQGSILLCRRAIEPREGFWTLPSGFMENGESVKEGAIRETTEEANASVSCDTPNVLYSVPDVGQVYIFYYARLLNLSFFPGEETLETRMFKPDDIPWSEISFSSVCYALESFIEDDKSGLYGLRQEEHNSYKRYAKVKLPGNL